MDYLDPKRYAGVSIDRVREELTANIRAAEEIACDERKRAAEQGRLDRAVKQLSSARATFQIRADKLAVDELETAKTLHDLEQREGHLKAKVLELKRTEADLAIWEEKLAAEEKQYGLTFVPFVSPSGVRATGKTARLAPDAAKFCASSPT